MAVVVATGSVAGVGSAVVVSVGGTVSLTGSVVVVGSVVVGSVVGAAGSAGMVPMGPSVPSWAIAGVVVASADIFAVFMWVIRLMAKRASRVKNVKIWVSQKCNHLTELLKG